MSTVEVPHRCRTEAGTETWPLRLTFTCVPSMAFIVCDSISIVWTGSSSRPQAPYVPRLPPTARERPPRMRSKCHRARSCVPRVPSTARGGRRCPFSGPREGASCAPVPPYPDRRPERSGRIRASGSFWCTGIPLILPQARILPGNPGIRPGSRPARTTRHRRARPCRRAADPGRAWPDTGNQTRIVASMVDRRAEEVPTQLAWPPKGERNWHARSVFIGHIPSAAGRLLP